MPPARASGPGPEATPARLLGSRYRLTAQLTGARPAGPPGPTTHLGRDEALGRPVLVRLVPSDDDRAGALLAAAATAGRCVHPALAQVYDAADDGEHAYVVREWADGEPLESLLREAPLSPARVRAMLALIAGALREADGVGTAHGRLHPGNVILGADGTVTLTDLGLAAAAAGLTPAPAADAAGIGAVGYAALTGRWPVAGEPWAALPAAPRPGGRLRSPRALDRAVPRRLDGVVMRALAADPDIASTREAPLGSPREVARALAALPAHTPHPHRAARLGRLAAATRWTVGILGLLVVGAAAWAAGTNIGALPGQGRYAALKPAAVPQRGAPQIAPPVPVPIRPEWVTSYNPEGDGPENPTATQLAVDGDPTTAWSTYTYRGRADLGGLKRGTGLLVDLQQPTAVREAVVSFLEPGADLELRAADAPADTVDGFRVVGRAHVSGDAVTLRTGAGGVRARYWLVWLTRLPAEGAGFRASVGEVQLRR